MIELIARGIEQIARAIAYRHGSKFAFRHPTLGMLTVARVHTKNYGTGWAWETDRYVDGHWQEYTGAAEFVEEMVQKALSLKEVADVIKQAHPDAEITLEYLTNKLKIETHHRFNEVLVISRKEIDDNIWQEKVAKFWGPPAKIDTKLPGFAGGDVEDPMLQWFEFSHLPPELQKISIQFNMLAKWIVESLPRNPERSTALRKLMEAKDCAVRAPLYRP